LIVSDRFPPLSPEAMTDAQRAAWNELVSGPRKGGIGPFKALLRSPDLMTLVQKVGAYVRFETSIPPALNELAILITARFWTAQFEWYAHNRLALAAGLDPAIPAAIALGQRPAHMSEDAAIVYDFCHTLMHQGAVPDEVFARATTRFGERGVMDLTGACGYYTLVSLVLNVDRTPLPPGEPLSLSPLA
jgi:4-carboxymuconolactone decarboxylase